MKRFLIIFAALALAGCASGFKKANEENTKRQNYFQDTMLVQAANDLTAINACFLRSSGYIVTGTNNLLVKVGEPSSGESCVVMAGMLRQASTFLTAFSAFLTQPAMARVPAAPEEIAQDILKHSMKFSIMKHGLNAVERVVSSGHLAQSQLAQQAIEAAAKPTPNPILITVPEGGSAGVLSLD